MRSKRALYLYFCGISTALGVFLHCTARTGAEFDKGCSQGLYLSLRHHNASPTPVTGVIGQLLPRESSSPPLVLTSSHTEGRGVSYLLKPPPPASSKPHLVHVSLRFFFSPSPLLALNKSSRASSTNPQHFRAPSVFGHFA